MIPIRDQIPSKSYPVVTRGIIGVNILVYILQMMQGENIERFIYMYGLVPARYSVPEVASHFSSGEQVFALISFMFLHGGFFHLLGNMWFLHIFGDNVEDRMGSTRFLLFYLLCGWASGFAHLWSSWTSTVPTIGASGAIGVALLAARVSGEDPPPAPKAAARKPARTVKKKRAARVASAVRKAAFGDAFRLRAEGEAVDEDEWCRLRCARGCPRIGRLEGPAAAWCAYVTARRSPEQLRPAHDRGVSG